MRGELAEEQKAEEDKTKAASQNPKGTVGAVAVVQNVLNTASNGTVSNNSIYQYGTR